MASSESKITKCFLKKTIYSLLSTTSRTSEEIKKFNNNFKCNDVLFYTWKNLMKILVVNKSDNHIFMLNVLELLENITLPKNKTKKKNINNNENEIKGLKNSAIKFDMIGLKKFVTKVWQLLINRNMDLIVHKKLLLILIESYLLNLNNPIFLTDFLMASMSSKGIIGILALEGMSHLMQKHNIEYPNIYQKLYTMFEPDIFHKNYKSRLFYLADIFLSSTHLPEIIVASFAKKTSHLSLYCSSPDVPIILKFIGNLLIRHPKLKCMIHQPDSYEVSEDPFLINESDPTKTCASSSSLWEIALLKNHCLPKISVAANFINFNLPGIEYDLGEVLSNTYKDLFESECRKKFDKPSVTFNRPNHTIAKLSDDLLYKLLSLSD